MIKILVVDDETDLELLIRQKFRQQVNQQQYEFIFALNGLEALQKLKEYDNIQLVLCDINMPEMDGLTLLGKLNETKPLLKTIIVSAYGDMDNIRAAMNLGAFDFITKPINFKDLELTMEKTIVHIQEVEQTIKAIKENNILKMYVDENVLKFMGTREYEQSLLQNETIEASVTFIDICGFTSISESEPPNAVVELLNVYFDIFAQEIIAHDGIIDKFMGDCVMAVFKGDNHLKRAADASLSIRTKINQLHTIDSSINFQPKVSIGINSGEMISGNIGSSTLKRLDYTVIGDAVNMAQRLQSAAGVNQILIPEHCYQLLKSHYECKDMGTFHLKNKTVESHLYEIVGNKPG